ncbi:hypothetical protein [Desulfogranum marinum]|uniref:hypothetical protein n=1 Tax=Desulfogranum marinum TaxID=453220 RepID=UPI0029C78567|nr:hypothetical protein [Desulfogranum marinum]
MSVAHPPISGIGFRVDALCYLTLRTGRIVVENGVPVELLLQGAGRVIKSVIASR